MKNASSTAACLQPGRPASPPKKNVDWMKQTNRAHLPQSQQAFGTAVKDSAHVHDVFAHGPQNEVAAIQATYAESRFRMTNVPIGKPRPTGVALPASVTSGDFAFGARAKSSQPAKELLFPQDPGEDLHPEVYIKSHGSYVPGAQTKRNYDWSTTGLDPNQHTFGRADPKAHESAADCISQKKRSTQRVVSKAQVDYITAKARHIGKPTSYGNHTDPNRVFGLPSNPKAKPGDWGAGDSIRGAYGLDDDPKLGKATKKGMRNVTTETRAFGCPTIRDDIAPPKLRSVSDNQNYGTDAHAQALLFPSQFSSIGVHDEDFTKQRPPSTIRKIFANIGQVLTDDEFVRVWWRAATAGDINGDGIVSVSEFKSAVEEYEAAKNDTGTVPNWWDEAGREGPRQLASDVADSQ